MHFFKRHCHIFILAAGQYFEGDLIPGFVLGDRPGQEVRVVDLIAVQLQDDVAFLEAGGCRRADRGSPPDRRPDLAGDDQGAVIDA